MKVNRNLTVVFLLFIVGLSLISLFSPPRLFSPRENRYLAQRPRLTLNNILTGKFMAAYEQFVTDQFPGRDSWVLLKMDVEWLLNKQESSGIYFAQDGYLLERYELDERWLRQNADYISGFAQRTGLPTTLLLAPTAIAIYPEKLPPGAPTDEQQLAWQLVRERLGSGVELIDVWDSLHGHKQEPIYFRTDHHWTMRGAYYAYQALLLQQGKQPLPLSSLKSTIVSSNFYGTHYAKASWRRLQPDEIEVLHPWPAPAVSVYYPAEDLRRDSLFVSAYLDQVDQYAYFLGGNHGIMQIKTAANNGRSLLVVKDSYAHCFLPFLTAHYEHIHVLDLRYFSLSVSQYAQEHGCDEALFLFSISQFSQPASLHKLSQD
ncbi:MAG: hypothetical protein GX033_03420 [Firmicutes bacterium]|nr:hypothetical protein [Bacillota bacterium]